MKPKRVLLYVDCDHDVLASMKVFLESRGYIVRTCCDESEAKAICRDIPVDLLVIGLRTTFDNTWAYCPTVFTQGLGRDKVLQRVQIGLVRRPGPRPLSKRPKPLSEEHTWLLAGKQLQMRARMRARMRGV